MLRKLIAFSCISVIVSQDFYPNNLSFLNTNHIQFRWPQIPNVNSYILTITDEATGLSDSLINDNSRISIINGLIWGTTYRWQVCGIDQDDMIYCFDPLHFSISNLPNNFPNNITLLELNEDQYTPGLNLIDFRDIGISAVLDKFGEPIWFSSIEENVKFCVIEMLPNGNMVGTGWEGQFYNSGYEINFEGDIIFDSPVDGLHHDFIKTSDGTYMGLFKVFKNLPAPEECFGCSDTILWRGDKIIEFDLDGNNIWEWNMFDHISIDGYNPYDASHYNGTYLDWSHTNSIDYDEFEKMIYLSIRNISRIIKIDYQTGDIIWSIGDPDFMLEPDFPEEIYNSRQHNAKIINNGNILFFDNGTQNSPQLSRCVEVEIDEDAPSAVVAWEYLLPNSMFTSSNAECDRLDNEHTLISTGTSGDLLELNENDEIVWHLNVKLNTSSVKIMRNERIPNLYPSAYSFKINNLTGTFEEPQIIVDSLYIAEIVIYNEGWVDDMFSIYYLEEDANEILIDSIFVENRSSSFMTINLLEIGLSSPIVGIRLVSQNNPDQPSNVEFRLECDNEIPNCIGCMDPEALNYNPDAVIPDRCYLLNSIEYNINNLDYNYLKTIFPNPFNATTTIKFDVINSYNIEYPVSIDVIDISGRVVEILIDSSFMQGSYHIEWDAINHSSGIYFVRLTTDKISQTKKIILMK